MILGVTGHRPDKIGGYDDAAPLRQAIRNAIRERVQALQPAKGLTGMALGVDTDFALVCRELRVPYVAVLPFKGQEATWPYASRTRYYELCRDAVEVVTVSEPGYARWKMQTRNVWVVDHCQKLLAVWDGSAGGTANCVLYAHSVERDVDLINPRQLPGYPGVQEVW